MSSIKDEIPEINESIKSTLSYFGLFKYPLLPKEIHRFLNYQCDYKVFLAALTEMKNRNEVFLSGDGFYSLEENPLWSVERLVGNNRAEKLLYQSLKYVKKISSCPFVVSIAISGSLSKYYAAQEADIDYFIITKKNRLWIARTLLHFYKKFTFIGGNEHYYCMNYFIDESALEIDQKNIYSAIETVTLIPSYNNELISELKMKNTWVKEFLPNESYTEDLRFLLPKKKCWVKQFFEAFINLIGAVGINSFLMDATDRKWRRKWRKTGYPMENYDQAFYTTLNISKNHPANYQSQILTALESNTQLTEQPSCNL